MEIELKEYFKVIKKRIWIILSIVLLSSICTGIMSYYFIQPVYTASAALVVNKTSENQGLQSLDYSNVATNIMLINTYKEIIKTPAIMDKVLEKLPDVNVTSEILSKKIKVSTVNATQIMTIVVDDYSYSQAVKIVNTIAQVFKEQISNIMKVDNVSILNEAKEQLNPQPTSLNPKINIAISAIVALTLSIGIAFFLEFLDDSIKTERDVEKYLGIPTLGVITKIKSRDIKSKSVSQQRMVGDGSYVSAK
ncbi:Capsular polysaccharide biosynthesis protein [Paenibacillus sp. yr247]|uniref:YveK family protein n=1 Tax=Paenibacillus sp. yr247 TaxID=1761880 RepID=UPI00088A0BF0|nr:Wzz/FepE/Etk N-terminal domain-containing protein [Paenibacillus sp. yr247]SDN32594.1 Capsular polysaccharide biosynthesis protein [Paenibacillus sp. yr247]